MPAAFPARDRRRQHGRTRSGRFVAQSDPTVACRSRYRATLGPPHTAYTIWLAVRRDRRRAGRRRLKAHHTGRARAHQDRGDEQGSRLGRHSHDHRGRGACRAPSRGCPPVVRREHGDDSSRRPSTTAKTSQRCATSNRASSATAPPPRTPRPVPELITDQDMARCAEGADRGHDVGVGREGQPRRGPARQTPTAT